jgi:hypothetical protein
LRRKLIFNASSVCDGRNVWKIKSRLIKNLIINMAARLIISSA